jgi:hypothetical protein
LQKAAPRAEWRSSCNRAGSQPRLLVANESNALPLPPVIPDDRPRLERAITLLGCRARGELGASARAELTDLVGRYPDAGTAMDWKRSLKQVRDDEIFDRVG